MYHVIYHQPTYAVTKTYSRLLLVNVMWIGSSEHPQLSSVYNLWVYSPPEGAFGPCLSDPLWCLFSWSIPPPPPPPRHVFKEFVPEKLSSAKPKRRDRKRSKAASVSGSEDEEDDEEEKASSSDSADEPVVKKAKKEKVKKEKKDKKKSRTKGQGSFEIQNCLLKMYVN